MNKRIALLILLAWIINNAMWYQRYHKLDLDDMQANAMLDLAKDSIPRK